MGLNYEIMSLDENIDKKLNMKEMKNSKRITNIKNVQYYSESYNLYRLELSLYLNNNINLKNRIINIVRNDSIQNKKSELIKILYSIIDNKLSKKIKSSLKLKDMAKIVKEIKIDMSYNVKNIRNYCKTSKNKNKCNNSPHCIWANNECKFILSETMAIDCRRNVK